MEGLILGLGSFLMGIVTAVVINRVRWSVFPLSGGPKMLFGWLGGPPDPFGAPISPGAVDLNEARKLFADPDEQKKTEDRDRT